MNHKTNNDIIAEYVKAKYPEILETFNYKIYSMGEKNKKFFEAVEIIKGCKMGAKRKKKSLAKHLRKKRKKKAAESGKITSTIDLQRNTKGV